MYTFGINNVSQTGGTPYGLSIYGHYGLSIYGLSTTDCGGVPTIGYLIVGPYTFIVLCSVVQYMLSVLGVQ